MIPHRDYRDPFTGKGQSLSGDSASATDFLLHEVGSLRYRDWNHHGVVSPYWRLHCNLAAGNGVICDQILYPLDPGVAVLTPAGVRIHTSGPRVLLHTWFHFTPTRGYRLPQQAPISVRLTPLLRSLLREIVAGFRAVPRDSATSRLYHLSQSLLHGVFAAIDPSLYRSVAADLGALLNFIEDHPEDDLTLAALARRTGKSRSRFAAWFKETVDETPAHYVRRLRIRIAATRLGFGKGSIEEIAEATGFANRQHFTRVFTAQMGLGPGAYRRRHKQPHLSSGI